MFRKALNKINLQGSEVDNVKTEGQVGYSVTTPYSVFPKETKENLQSLEFSDTNVSKIRKDLVEYYNMLSIYLEGAPTLTEKQKFDNLNIELSENNLTSKDYLLLRDALLEIINYVVTIEKEALYGVNGADKSFKNSVRNFEDILNVLTTEINKNYSRLSDGVDGKLLPDKAITKQWLDSKLIETIEYLDDTQTIYVDRTVAATITAPNKKTAVIKIKE